MELVEGEPHSSVPSIRVTLSEHTGRYCVYFPMVSLNRSVCTFSAWAEDGWAVALVSLSLVTDACVKTLCALSFGEGGGIQASFAWPGLGLINRAKSQQNGKRGDGDRAGEDSVA